MQKIDNSWTLFLDRDGVINQRIPDRYVTGIDEFEFISSVREAIAAFSKVFGRIIVVTNQQGIGKGIMTEKQLENLHHYMKSEIEKAGGRIDAVYFCPDLERTNPICRKPAPGMALQAKKDFPEIDFKKSVMAGDSISDIIFGYRLGMTTVLVETKEEKEAKMDLENALDENFKIDYSFPGLWEFSTEM